MNAPNNKYITSVVLKFPKLFISLIALAPNIVGIAKKNENSVATTRLNPNSIPPIIVAADLDVPGIDAKHWNTPTPNADKYDISPILLILAFLPLFLFSITIKIIPYTINAIAIGKGL